MLKLYKDRSDDVAEPASLSVDERRAQAMEAFGKLLEHIIH